MRASIVRPLLGGLVVVGLVVTVSAWVASFVVADAVDGKQFVHAPFEDYEELGPGLKLATSTIFEEEVTALTQAPAGTNTYASYLYVGTSPAGGLHSIAPSSLQNLYNPIALGLGESIKRGTCNVNAIAVKDIDGDGADELLVSTSQIEPRGRPRLYAWTIGHSAEPRALTRPAIASSWSHGLGFLEDPESKTVSAFITYCGFGEIVEFRPHRSVNESGFSQESLSWKQVGQLPASGEWLQSADVDNDGRDELCVSTGYAEGRAEMIFYSRSERDRPLAAKRRIDESGRFGNVHFVVGNTDGSGTNDLIAWWCKEIDGGACEMIRYRLDGSGGVERTPIASASSDEIMPRDGQTAFFDLDGDGRAELLFGTRGGRILSYDPKRPSPIRTEVRLKGSVGPIVGFTHPFDPTRTGLAFGWRNSVVMLQSEKVTSMPRRR